MSDLYPYQRDAVAAIQTAYREGARSVLLQLPTGGGKTHLSARGVIAPSVAKGRRVAFVADLEEIVDDTADRLRALGLTVGTVKAGRAADATAPVQVCSLQTLARRVDALPDAERVIIDEAHVSSARTAREILQAYRQRGALVLGLTATPARGDGQPLDEFERLVCGPSMRELIAAGALVSCTVFAPPRVLDKGVCEDPVQAVLTRAMERRCVVFAPDAAQAVRISTELTSAGHTTVAVLDGMGRDERRTVRQRLSAGTVQSLVTVRALQKGFDAPLLDCAVLTTHGTVTTYLQSVGRVLRVCAGKAGALVLDLRGAVYLHGLPEDDRVWSLEGTQGRAQHEKLTSLRRCADCHAVFPARKVCPRCGSVHVVDPRPLRVQRAEMFAASDMPVEVRARKYVDATVRAMVRNSNGRMPEHIAVKRAREKAPAWVREALETQQQKRSA